MDRSRLRQAVPILYGILVVASLFFFPGVSTGVIVVGAMLVGLFYVLAARGRRTP